MAENPDRKDPIHGGKNFVPSGGDLRFVLRDVREEPGDTKTRPLRILQRWEWSYVDSKWDWYDVHLAEEKDDD